ncbi:MAG: beta-galactosidase [Lachnospiraceae bacterium]|nr:beta-galactosidase [Lachnospiraceae bacterium]
MKHADRIYHGGDYNPDQWDEATIDKDMELFKKAGINFVVLPVFSWAKLEPQEGVYDFGWLDKLMDKFAEHDLKVCLATPTTAQPAWLSKNYPEVLPVDKQGRKRTHGMRVFFCVNSPKYRERARAMAEEMAKRYAHHPSLVVWHVANEYGTFCYCPTCEKKFRQWLKNRYGTINNLNEKWHTSFWGRTVYDFEEIMLPTELNDDYRFNPIVNLDYRRFMTDSTIECFENEAEVLRRYNPEITVQTNISGHIENLDQFKMVKHMDIAAWDNYPKPTDDKSFIAYKHDLMRGLKGGESFMMQEQSPNQQNWQPYSKLKRPGELRMLSYQAMAHGSDTCSYFQLRQSIAGQEMFHGAVISHNGREDTRTFREVSQIGKELQQIGDSFIGGRRPAKAGIIFDWDNWWAMEYASQNCMPNKNFNYLKKISKYHKVLFNQNIPLDMLSIEADFSGYRVIFAPYLYMIKGDIAERLKGFVEQGGTLVTTTLSGLVDEHNRAVFGEYPGPLKELLGIWVEETDALPPDEKNQICMEEGSGFTEKSYSCGFHCDVIHTREANVLGRYGMDFYQGTPVVTKNSYGKGQAYYLGTEPDEKFLAELARVICSEQELAAPYQTVGNVELTERVNEKYKTVFALNYDKEQEAEIDLKDETFTELITGKTLTGKAKIPAYDLLVLRKDI